MPAKKTYRKRFNKKRVYKKKVRSNAITNIFHSKRYTQVSTNGYTTSVGSSLTIVDGVWSMTTAASIGSHYLSFSLYHILEDLPNFGEYSAMFDSYKLKKVTVKILPLCNSVNTGDASSATDTGAYIHHNTDYNDGVYYAASVAGVADMQQDKGYKLRQGFKTISKTYAPKLKSDVYALAGAAETGIQSMWLTTTNMKVPHFGSKYILEVFNNTVTSQVFRFKLLCSYYVDLKGSR